MNMNTENFTEVTFGVNFSKDCFINSFKSQIFIQSQIFQAGYVMSNPKTTIDVTTVYVSRTNVAELAISESHNGTQQRVVLNIPTHDMT